MKVCNYIKVSEEAEKKATEDLRTHNKAIKELLNYRVAQQVSRLHRWYVMDELGKELDKAL